MPPVGQTDRAAQAEFIICEQSIDGNHEFARLLELCLAHSQTTVEAALALAREQSDWSADTVRQVLHWAEGTPPKAPPLDPATYPAYQVALPPPDVAAYNQLLEVRP